jgi:hypothetical protein
LSRTETSSSQALNLSVEEVPPTLWSSLQAWLKSSVNCVVDIFGFSSVDVSKGLDLELMMIAKGKIESPRAHSPLTCMRMVWVSQRHRQLNDHSMDLEQCSERSRWLIIRTFWYCIGLLFERALDTCRHCALWLYMLALSSPWKHSLLSAVGFVRVQEIAIFA